MTEPKQAAHPKHQRARSATDPQADPTRCGYHGGLRKDGKPCVGPIIRGTTRCRMHAGTKATVAKEKGEIALLVREAINYEGPVIDSGEVMVRAASIAWHRAVLLGEELQRVVAEHVNLRDALVADAWTVDLEGRKVKTGEYVRALTQLEAQWWDRAFAMNTKVTAAKLAIADRAALRLDRQAEALAHLAQAVLLDPRIGLTPAQRAILGEVWRDHSSRLGITAT